MRRPLIFWLLLLFTLSVGLLLWLIDVRQTGASQYVFGGSDRPVTRVFSLMTENLRENPLKISLFEK